MKRTLLLFLLPLLFLPGCVQQLLPSRSLMGLSIGMTKQQVVKILGEPTAFRGATVSANGETTELFEYTCLIEGSVTTWCCWLYFKENRLVQWGAPNDWRKEPKESDIVQEIRVR